MNDKWWPFFVSNRSSFITVNILKWEMVNDSNPNIFGSFLSTVTIGAISAAYLQSVNLQSVWFGTSVSTRHVLSSQQIRLLSEMVWYFISIHHGPRVEKCSFHWLDGLVLDCPIKAINGFPVYFYNRCKKVLSTGRECESPDKAIQWVSPSSVGLILMMVQISGYCSALTFGVRF